MIRVIHKKVDITELVSKYSWSGSLNTVARKVEFEIVVSPTDKYLPKVTIMNGDMIDLVDEKGAILYRGHVFSKEKSTNSNTMSVVTYDYTIYLVKNKGTFNFKNATPKQVAERISKIIGIKLGNIANPGVRITRIFENVSYYEVIQTAYTFASKRTGKKYHINYKGSKLNIEEVGKSKSNYIISEDSDIYDSSYAESIENIVNRVVMYNEKGKRLGIIENKNDTKKYGVMQSVLKDKDARSKAREELKTLERSAKIEALGDVKCITGNAIQIKESYTGLNGEFYIISDSHTFEGTNHTMSLDLSFNKMMDEKESGSKPEKK